ncbi:flagellar biosynthesis regulator FlaF [Microvirga terrae]|uniref:Flagellar biosynthesis regulator FlaF n=1 Tax=Microvirga terrae TaxID=2740529 RepID=A0ABY5RSR4_9HYPH|nr:MULTISPECIES: flagellar biosynthesis regulator FlaF [Microvirga]MBQ0824769.1 flagellar biosynthesis regulator FlaF [Microvirga sp. HBU67558]UVF20295.1 flagellar biosynthesis regulator FlaF [Microvirga terrae]
MYRFSYAEVVEDAPRECRQREYEVFERAIGLLKAAEGRPSRSPEVNDAMEFLQRLWTAFVQDLAHPDNELPDKLKAQLISIGFWVMRESSRVALGEHNDLNALIDINTMIQEGLR